MLSAPAKHFGDERSPPARTSRGEAYAAAATRTFRGDASRPRRGTLGRRRRYEPHVEYCAWTPAMSVVDAILAAMAEVRKAEALQARSEGAGA